MLDGEINSIIADKGFGFIRPAAGGPDVFFHMSALNVGIERLSDGQRVRYEMDAKAANDKPRAIKVEPIGALKPAGTNSPQSRDARPTRPARNDRRPPSRSATRSGARSDDRPRRPPRQDDRPVEYGFVTKMHRKEQRGFISSVKHGPEFLFEAKSVRGEKRYWELELGDYVKFVVGTPDPLEPKQPIALNVEVTPRNNVFPDAIESLGRHPKSRRRKPTWRN